MESLNSGSFDPQMYPLVDPTLTKTFKILLQVNYTFIESCKRNLQGDPMCLSSCPSMVTSCIAIVQYQNQEINILVPLMVPMLIQILSVLYALICVYDFMQLYVITTTIKMQNYSKNTRSLAAIHLQPHLSLHPISNLWQLLICSLFL